MTLSFTICSGCDLICFMAYMYPSTVRYLSTISWLATEFRKLTHSLWDVLYETDFNAKDIFRLAEDRGYIIKGWWNCTMVTEGPTGGEYAPLSWPCPSRIWYSPKKLQTQSFSDWPTLMSRIVSQSLLLHPMDGPRKRKIPCCRLLAFYFARCNVTAAVRTR